MKRTARLKLKTHHIHILWEALCKHQEKYMEPTNPFDWNPDDCSECALAKIPWRPKLGYKRDICFLIWRVKIFE
jgi:hypothetical protein